MGDRAKRAIFVIPEQTLVASGMDRRVRPPARVHARWSTAPGVQLRPAGRDIEFVFVTAEGKPAGKIRVIGPPLGKIYIPQIEALR